ncbi:MAG: hypothetical protein K6B41_01695 [Butyrivibrio sp.]|nr:hypothetical protein [Butyrivibrio sp.]
MDEYEKKAAELGIKEEDHKTLDKISITFSVIIIAILLVLNALVINSI